MWLQDLLNTIEYAVNQIDRNIDLVRYIKFGKELIAFEQLESKTTEPVKDQECASKNVKKSAEKTFEEQLQGISGRLKILYEDVRNYVLSLDEGEITESQLKQYVAFKKMRNIVCLYINQTQITLFLSLNPDNVVLEEGFAKDMRGKGHWGTGDLQVIIKNEVDFDKAKLLIDRAYQEN